MIHVSVVPVFISFHHSSFWLNAVKVFTIVKPHCCLPELGVTRVGAMKPLNARILDSPGSPTIYTEEINIEADAPEKPT